MSDDMDQNIDKTQLGDRPNDHTGNVNAEGREHAPAAIDKHGELDIVIGKEHLENLLSLANAGKTLTAEEEGLVMEYAQVGRAYCTICGEWTGIWMSFLDESLYPPLCDLCAGKVF